MGRLFAGIVVAVCLTQPTPVQADPITFNYRIDVLEVCGGPAIGCEAFRTSFPLRMTFSAADSDGSTFEFYGSVSFSEVPLARPASPVGVPLQVSSGIGHGYHAVDGGWQHSGSAFLNVQIAGLNATPEWQIELFGTQLLSAPPVLSPISLAHLLGRGESPFGFQFQYRGFADGVFAPPVLDYFGTATLVETATPVPEPASVLLLASGLGVITALRRRRA